MVLNVKNRWWDNNMLKELAEKGKFKVESDVFDLPFLLRKKIHEDIIELSVGMDDYLEENGGYAAFPSEEWPVTYMFSTDTVIVIISVLEKNTRKVNNVFKFNLPRIEVDELLKETQKC